MFDCRNNTLPQIKKKIMADRNIEKLNDFMSPSLDYMIDLEEMKNLVKAANIINMFMHMDNKIIGIHFDTDTDGTTSGAIVYNFLRNFIPEDRLRTYTDIGKSHGLRNFDVNEMSDCDVVIIVDSLDNTIDKYKQLYDMGKEVIVLDHHDIDKTVPYDDYITLVSSQDENYPNHALCGAGVCLKTCIYIDRLNGTNYADKLYDLAACGLIADMVDISVEHMENRAIIYKGLMESTNPAIKYICKDYSFDSNAVSYYIAPKINALCRTNRNKEGYLIFTKTDEKEIENIVDIMDMAKDEQNKEVDRILETYPVKTYDNISFMQIDTPYGVSGLVANSLVSQYHKPAIVVYNEISSDDNCLHGSARSPQDLFRSYCSKMPHTHTGGHEAAFGIWFDKSKDNLLKCLEKINKDAEIFKGKPSEADLLINVRDITMNLIAFCQRFNYVSGMGNPSIKVEIDDIEKYNINSFKNGKHTYITSRSTEHFTYQYNPKCIQWNLPQAITEQYIMENGFVNLKPKGTLQFGFRNTAQLICDELIPDEFVKVHTLDIKEDTNSKSNNIDTDNDVKENKSDKIIEDNKTVIEDIIEAPPEFKLSQDEMDDISMELS